MPILFNNKYRIPSARLQNWNYANEAMYFVTICTKNRENYFGEIAMTMGTPPNNAVETPCNDAVETPCMASLRATEIGKIAYEEWFKTPLLRPDMRIELGEFVVMPNHIHGIIIIGANEYNRNRDTESDSERIATYHGDEIQREDAMQQQREDAMQQQREDAMQQQRGDAMQQQRGDAMQRRRRDAMHGVSTNANANPNAPNTEYKNQFAPQSKNLSSIIRGYKSAVTTYARKNGIPFDWQPRFHDHIIRSLDDYHRISNYIANNPAKWLEDKFYQS